jgi:tetratricopeptide (TPR) repeat protein
MADHYSVVDLIYNSEEKRKLGIERLITAYENGVGAKWEAGRILLLIHLHETKNYKEASKIGENLFKRFPNNLESKSLYIESLIYLDKIEKSEKLLAEYSKSYENISHKGKEIWKVRERYLSAVLNMQKGNYEDAKKSFLFVIENYNLEFQWFKALSYLKIGQIYDLNNQRENAKKYYKLAINTRETTKAVKEAKEYLKAPFTIEK